MIIETSANHFYRVTETNSPDLAHCWFGIRLKKQRNGEFVMTAEGRRAHAKGRPELVRKAGCRVVEQHP